MTDSTCITDTGVKVTEPIITHLEFWLVTNSVEVHLEVADAVASIARQHGVSLAGSRSETGTPTQVRFGGDPVGARWASEHRHCRACGRELVEVVERYGFDSQTGEPRETVWMTCPRWGRNWRNMWTGLNAHQSWNRDFPITERVYR